MDEKFDAWAGRMIGRTVEKLDRALIDAGVGRTDGVDGQRAVRAAGESTCKRSKKMFDLYDRVDRRA